MRQSGVETGVAVVAALPLPPEPEHVHETDEPPEALSESAGDEFLPIEEEDRAIIVHRHTVFTARYRHTLKGPDRGKWEVDVQRRGRRAARHCRSGRAGRDEARRRAVRAREDLRVRL